MKHKQIIPRVHNGMFDHFGRSAYQHRKRLNLPPESKTGGLTFSPAGPGSQEGSYFWGGAYFWVHPLCCHFTFPDTENV